MIIPDQASTMLTAKMQMTRAETRLFIENSLSYEAKSGTLLLTVPLRAPLAF